jgi:hypothetical protein
MEEHAMTVEGIAVWREASAIDPTLHMRSADWPELERIIVHPQHYSLATLHAKMAKSEPVVFRDCPVALKGPKRFDPDKALLKLMIAGFPKGERARVKMGPAANLRYLEIPQVVARWASGKSVMNVSDLHFRDTKFEAGIDASVLTDCNLLRLGSEDMAIQEMFTLVISTKGAMSDSHSDDPDGSNHCFIGKKLWLAWDTFEGKAKGLEDVSRDTTEGRASFSMRRFLALKSARWFTVARNETLFLPGRMTHKVITLENYIGIGCFYVTLPNCLGTLMRWNKHGPLWTLNSRANDSLVDEITQSATKKIYKLRTAPPRTQEKWGLSYLRRTAKHFDKKTPPAEKSFFLKNQPFVELMNVIGSVRIR